MSCFSRLSSLSDDEEDEEAESDGEHKGSHEEQEPARTSYTRATRTEVVVASDAAMVYSNGNR